VDQAITKHLRLLSRQTTTTRGMLPNPGGVTTACRSPVRSPILHSGSASQQLSRGIRGVGYLSQIGRFGISTNARPKHHRYLARQDGQGSGHCILVSNYTPNSKEILGVASALT